MSCIVRCPEYIDAQADECPDLILPLCYFARPEHSEVYVYLCKVIIFNGGLLNVQHPPSLVSFPERLLLVHIRIKCNIAAIIISSVLLLIVTLIILPYKELHL